MRSKVRRLRSFLSATLINKLHLSRLRYFLVNRKTRHFYQRYLIFPPEIRKILNRRFPPIDAHILKRNPSLEFEKHDGMIYAKIKDIYFKENEIRSDPTPYENLAKGLLPFIISENIKTISDVGCSNGLLIYNLAKEIPLNVKGYEVFDFYLDGAPESMKKKIEIKDFRRQVVVSLSDLTICMETAEHIDPLHISTFLNNIKEMTSKYLLMSWSSTYPDISAPPQHICPLSKKDFKKILSAFDFQISKKNSELNAHLKKQPNLYPWWLDSLTLLEKSK